MRGWRPFLVPWCPRGTGNVDEQRRFAHPARGGSEHNAIPPRLMYHPCPRRRATGAGMTQAHWRKVEKARQRLVLCRLMIDIMRTVHGAYAPASEPFGARLETFFIGLCVAIGDFDAKPFSVAKI